MKQHWSLAAFSAMLIAGGASADTVVTFDSGTEGWTGSGNTFIDTTGGNPGNNLRTIFQGFGITFRNLTNAEFIGDYTLSASKTLEIDTKVEQIDFFGTPVSRPWLVQLRDYDNPPPGYPYVSVWYKFADISEAAHGSWTTFSVSIVDTLATELPPGWGGTGAEDPTTFEPILPADRTFTDVIDGIDEIVYTTFEPGFFFGETAHDIRIDNVSIFSTGNPVPGAVPTLLLDKSVMVVDDLVLSWQPSCGASAQNYAIYEGLIGSWYSHGRIDCSDAGGDRTEEITPDTGDRYYLVVPLDATDEGSYGTATLTGERPTGISTCRPSQDTGSCR